ncbi:MAG: SRPBCC domain-containing protein [Saprospiraceae bacterium]|nr:SRPBCC domain-containing protein [Saprospiraceae bacterium]
MFQIFHDVDIKASASDIYKMITTEEGLNIWWTTKSYGTPQINQQYNFYFTDDYDWYARVIDCETDKFINFKLEKADKDWISTSLKFEIIPKDTTTNMLRFEHIGWKQANDHFRRTNFCWGQYLDIMKKWLEK